MTQLCHSGAWLLTSHMCPASYLRRSSHLSHCGCSSAVLPPFKVSLSSFLVQLTSSGQYLVGLTYVGSIAVHCTTRVQSPSLRLQAIRISAHRALGTYKQQPFALSCLPRASCFRPAVRMAPVWTLPWQCLVLRHQGSVCHNNCTSCHSLKYLDSEVIVRHPVTSGTLPFPHLSRFFTPVCQSVENTSALVYGVHSLV